MEREAAELTERAAGTPSVRGAERPCSVLEYGQVGQLLDARGPAEEMHGEHGLRPRRDAACGIGGIHVHRHRIDVYEHWRRTDERDDIRRRRERVGGHE